MKTHWKPEKLLSRISREHRLQSWLKDDRSLTHKLRLFCPELKVEVLNEAQQKPLREESEHLRLSVNQQCWVRSVLLKCQGTALIYARTVIPRLDSNNPWHKLQELGNQPLGEILFDPQQTKIHRSEFIYARMKLADLPYLNEMPDRELVTGYARQSVFEQHQAPLLLTEVFLPGFTEIHI